MTAAPATAQHHLGRERFIAHRGYAQRYPENTLPAVSAAIDAGALAVEIDVQLTMDCVPVLMHDPSLKRTAGANRLIWELTLCEAKEFDVGERARLEPDGPPAEIPTLREFALLLEKHPHVHAFVEIKRHSVEKFSCCRVVDRVMQDIQDALSQITIISFLQDVIVAARHAGAPRVGWILSDWRESSLRTLRELLPEVVFCDHQLLPNDESRVWDGPWVWAVYEVTEVEHARSLVARGVDLIETMRIREMLQAAEVARLTERTL